MREIIRLAILCTVGVFVGAFLVIAFVAFWFATWDFFARIVGPGMYPPS